MPGWILWAYDSSGHVSQAPGEPQDPHSRRDHLVDLFDVLRLLLERRVELDTCHTQRRSLHVVWQAAERRRRAGTGKAKAMIVPLPLPTRDNGAAGTPRPEMES